MAKFTLTHEIDCDPETFWKLFFDKEFNDELYKKALGFPAYSVLEQKETDQSIFRKVSGTPKMDVPGPVAKIMGSNFSYVEEGTLDKSSKVWRWKITPSVMPDKMKTEGTVRVEPLGTNRCKRISEITLEAKIFGIGGIVESASEKNLRSGWDDSAKYMNKHLREHAAK